MNASFNPYSAPQSETVGADVVYATGALATLGERFVARMIDQLLLFLAVLPGLLVMFLLVSSDDPSDLASPPGEGPMLFGMLLAGVGALLLSIYQWNLTVTTGQTLGKRSMKIRIVSLAGGQVDFLKGVVLRTWVPTGINSIIPFGLFGLLDALFIFGNQRRCIHDYLAGTKVVQAAGENPYERRGVLFYSSGE